MPSFSEMKAKASGVASAGVSKAQNIKDRNTSVPLKKTNWDPYSGQPPPPPPPPRVNPRNKPELAPLPPPPRRTSSTSASSSTSTPTPSSRAPSSSPAPPLPNRAPLSTPPLPSRNPLSTPPLPGRGALAPPPLPGRGPSAPPILPSRGQSSAPPPPPPRGQSAAPPPPPPSRSTPPAIAKAASLPGPPPVSRSSRPDLAPRQIAPAYARHEEEEEMQDIAEEEPSIDWANLSEEDKRVFFSWLDEFFAKFLSISIPPRSANGTIRKHIAHSPPAAVKPTWARPYGGTPDSNNFTLSHPPPSTHGCSALDLANYFHPSTNWAEAWYASTSSELPPPLVGNTDLIWATSWKSYGPTKTSYVGILFSDLSICWGSVEFNTAGPFDPNRVKRDAVYLPRPKALGSQELEAASETYGDTVASFAESFLGTGQYCARGECWDLANEALKYFADFDYIPKPVPSISRTHGHLIYEGKAANKGKELVGRWRGGDSQVRRGDIVEWRRVRIGVIGAPPGSYFKLGDPDHTAVVVNDAVPSVPVKDGAAVKPSELGSLVVVEQSVGQPPEKREYDLRGLEEGEMWIYRPVGMEAYLGVGAVGAKAPEDVQGLLRV